MTPIVMKPDKPALRRVKSEPALLVFTTDEALTTAEPQTASVFNASGNIEDIDGDLDVLVVTFGAENMGVSSTGLGTQASQLEDENHKTEEVEKPMRQATKLRIQYREAEEAAQRCCATAKRHNSTFRALQTAQEVERSAERSRQAFKRWIQAEAEEAAQQPRQATKLWAKGRSETRAKKHLGTSENRAQGKLGPSEARAKRNSGQAPKLWARITSRIDLWLERFPSTMQRSGPF